MSFPWDEESERELMRTRLANPEFTIPRLAEELNTKLAHKNPGFTKASCQGKLIYLCKQRVWTADEVTAVTEIGDAYADFFEKNLFFCQGTYPKVWMDISLDMQKQFPGQVYFTKDCRNTYRAACKERGHGGPESDDEDPEDVLDAEVPAVGVQKPRKPIPGHFAQFVTRPDTLGRVVSSSLVGIANRPHLATKPTRPSRKRQRETEEPQTEGPRTEEPDKPAPPKKKRASGRYKPGARRRSRLGSRLGPGRPRLSTSSAPPALHNAYPVLAPAPRQVRGQSPYQSHAAGQASAPQASEHPQDKEDDDEEPDWINPWEHRTSNGRGDPYYNLPPAAQRQPPPPPPAAQLQATPSVEVQPTNFFETIEGRQAEAKTILEEMGKAQKKFLREWHVFGEDSD